jgi:hypothetical protein
MLLRTWKSFQLIHSVFTAPPDVCGWQEACVALMDSNHGCRALHFRFDGIFRLRTQKGIVECRDVTCLLKVLPAMLMEESGIFKITRFGNRLHDHPFTPLWHTIARLIILGILCEERDVFKLAPRLWYRLYQISNSTLPVRITTKYTSHSGLNMLVGLLAETGLFFMTDYQFIA